MIFWVSKLTTGFGAELTTTRSQSLVSAVAGSLLSSRLRRFLLFDSGSVISTNLDDFCVPFKVLLFSYNSLSRATTAFVYFVFGAVSSSQTVGLTVLFLSMSRVRWIALSSSTFLVVVKTFEICGCFILCLFIVLVLLIILIVLWLWCY